MSDRPTVDEHRRLVSDLCLALPEAVAASLIAAAPERYFNPAYLGPRGWAGLDLDAPGVTQDAIASLIHDSYKLTAPKRLSADLGVMDPA